MKRALERNERSKLAENTEHKEGKKGL